MRQVHNYFGAILLMLIANCGIPPFTTNAKDSPYYHEYNIIANETAETLFIDYRSRYRGSGWRSWDADTSTFLPNDKQWFYEDYFVFNTKLSYTYFKSIYDSVTFATKSGKILDTLLWYPDSTDFYMATDTDGVKKLFINAGDTIFDTLVITAVTDTGVTYHFNH